ncbi:hypothetical protein DENSPDRAFT_692166 [Dentipellis sp. KUC8613]|nr:hypothetical protein DENSPDRAFT_692166 [Dentipellis sp. KUC8613]
MPFPRLNGRPPALLQPPESNDVPLLSTRVASPFPPPAMRNTIIDHGMHFQCLLPHREYSRFPTDEGVDELGRFSEPGLQLLALCIRFERPSGARRPPPLTRRHRASSHLPLHQSLCHSIHPSAYLNQQMRQLKTTSSAVVPTSPGPSRSKRKATAPGTRQGKTRARRRAKCTAKGMGMAVLRARARIGLRRCGRKCSDYGLWHGTQQSITHILYDGVAGLIELELLETFSLDGVL